MWERREVKVGRARVRRSVPGYICVSRSAVAVESERWQYRMIASYSRSL